MPIRVVFVCMYPFAGPTLNYPQTFRRFQNLESSSASTKLVIYFLSLPNTERAQSLLVLT